MLGCECRYAKLISNQRLWYSGWDGLEYALKASHGAYSGFGVGQDSSLAAGLAAARSRDLAFVS